MKTTNQIGLDKIKTKLLADKLNNLFPNYIGIAVD